MLKPILDQSDPWSILWWTPQASQLKPDPAVKDLLGVGREHLAHFEHCRNELNATFEKHKQSLLMASNERWLNVLFNQLHLWINRLSSFTSSFYNVVFMVAECQRRCLDLRAYADYMLLVKDKLATRRSSSHPVFPPPLPFLGAITYDVQIAEEFALTGVPVWLIRDLSQFSSNVRIKALAPLQEAPSSVVRKLFPGVHRSVFVGPSGSPHKLNAIYQYSREHFARDEPERDVVFSPPAPPLNTTSRSTRSGRSRTFTFCISEILLLTSCRRSTSSPSHFNCHRRFGKVCSRKSSLLAPHTSCLAIRASVSYTNRRSCREYVGSR